MKTSLFLLVFCCLTQVGSAIPVLLSTATNSQGSGPNQGWWSTGGTQSANNPGIVVGSFSTSGLYRNFFGFDTTALAGQTVLSATLIIPASLGVGAQDLNYDLSAVTTSLVILMQKNLNPNTSIFNSLAGGTSYGSYVVSSGPPANPFQFVLNAAGIAALQTAATSNGFFVLGGSSSQTESLGGNHYFFGNTGDTVTLLVNLAPELDGSQAVSAFAALALLTLTAVRRQRSSESSSSSLG